MYDISLIEDVKEFKNGSDNIYELRNRYQTICKVIKNRTKEKLDILYFLLHHKIIDKKVYDELLGRVKSDCKISFLYLMGMVNLD